MFWGGSKGWSLEMNFRLLKEVIVDLLHFFDLKS